MMAASGLIMTIMASWERPGWEFAVHGGRPPLPYTPTGRLKDVTVAYFLGNASGFPNPAEALAESRFGIAGIGWQLNNVPSNHSHLEAAEVRTALQLKVLRAGVRILVSRNTEVVSTFMDSVSKAFANTSKDNYWVKGADGHIVETPWISPAGNTPKRWINFSHTEAAEWWANEYIGPVLSSPLFDGLYFDCSCENPPGVELAAFAAVQAGAQHAVDALLPRAAAARKWVSAWDNEGSVRRSSCAKDMRTLIQKARGSYSTLQLLFDYRDHEQSLELSAAALLIARGLYGTLMWPVIGAYEKAAEFPWNSTLLEHDWGGPLEEPREEPMGVFVRRYEHGVATVDCTAEQRVVSLLTTLRKSSFMGVHGLMKANV